MSIENGVTAGAPKAAAQGVAGHGHRKAQAGAAATGDFASLLMNFGAEELAPEPGLAVADEDALPALPLAADQLPSDKPEVLVDPGVGLPAAQAPLVPEGGLEQGGQATERPVLAVVTGDAASRPARPIPGRAEPARADTDADTSRETLPVVTDAAASAGRDAEAQQAGEVQPLLRQATLVQRMAQQRMQATETAAQAGKQQRGEDVAARLGWRISENAAPASGQPQAFLMAGAGEAGLRPFERRSEKVGERNGGVGEVGAWSGQPQAEGARLDVPMVAPDGGLTTEMRVAEQVSYWIGRGAQSAELELDGLGEGPVKVSIALQGQEARVEFRADQAQTRQVLQDSMPHLRELLEREGLVLSGMSVGSSGTDGGNGQSSQGRQGGRQGHVAVPELPVAALAAQRGAPLSGRSVDLFV